MSFEYIQGWKCKKCGKILDKIPKDGSCPSCEYPYKSHEGWIHKRKPNDPYPIYLG